MNGTEFIRRARRYAKKTKQECRLEPSHGKGSHQRLWVGRNFTTVPNGELKPGLFRAMLRQLDIGKEDF